MSELDKARAAADVYEHILSVILPVGTEISGKAHSVSIFNTKFGDVPAVLFEPGSVTHTVTSKDMTELQKGKNFPKGVTPNLGMIGIGTILADRLAVVRSGDMVYVKRTEDAHSEDYDQDYKVYTVLVDAQDGNGYVPAQNLSKARPGANTLTADQAIAVQQQIVPEEDPF